MCDVLRADVDAAVEQELLLFAATTVSGDYRQRDNVRQHWRSEVTGDDEGLP